MNIIPNGDNTTAKPIEIGNMNTIGSCSECGGPVQIPQVWFGTIPPTPACAHCGATPAEAYGPVIPMKKQKQSLNTNTESTFDNENKGYLKG